jgi:hypothetical protein
MSFDRVLNESCLCRSVMCCKAWHIYHTVSPKWIWTAKFSRIAKC